VTHDFCQNGFARLVNECHVDQLDDAPAGVAFVALFTPSQPQLSGPLTDQLTLQRPPLHITRIGYIDLQHYSPSTSRQKPPTLKAHHSRPASALYNSFLNHLVPAEYVRTSVNGFCTDELTKSVHSHRQNSLLLLL
jgi:hypothetical protein